MKRADALTERQALFAKLYSAAGGKNATECATAAGYCPGNRNAAGVRAHELLRNARVLEAIKVENDRRLRGGTALGVNVLLHLAEHAESEQVRFNSAKELLDRGGMQLASLSQHQHHVVVEQRSDAELRARAQELWRDLGYASPLVIENALPVHKTVEFAPLNVSENESPP